MTQRKNEKGFTLVELAIVLVIIGLIISGVLVGQDLIKAAEIRAVVSDVERYNAAANTFRSKYGGVPGDLQAQRATNFGFDAGDGTAGASDGSSLVESCVANGAGIGCETALFWIHLSQASLISDSFTVGGNNIADGDSGPPAAVNTTALAQDIWPAGRLRDTAFFHVFPANGRNHFALANYTATMADPGVITSSAAITTIESQNIDDKLDDGYPTTGGVRAISAITAAAGYTQDAGAASATGVCVNTGTTPDSYNTASDVFANEMNCQLVMRASF